MEKNEIGGACRSHGGEERFIQGFGGDLRKTDLLQDAGAEGRTIKWIFKKRNRGTECVDSARKIHTCFTEVVLRFQILYVAHAPLCSFAWLGYQDYL